MQRKDFKPLLQDGALVEWTSGPGSIIQNFTSTLHAGREGFLREVHRWVDEYGGKICKQMRRLGTSCDWSRQAFTMDEQCSAAVQEAFLRMHKDGLIYRDVRLVNWDCMLLTAVSDSEVGFCTQARSTCTRTFAHLPHIIKRRRLAIRKSPILLDITLCHSQQMHL